MEYLIRTSSDRIRFHYRVGVSGSSRENTSRETLFKGLTARVFSSACAFPALHSSVISSDCSGVVAASNDINFRVFVPMHRAGEKTAPEKSPPGPCMVHERGQQGAVAAAGSVAW